MSIEVMNLREARPDHRQKVMRGQAEICDFYIGRPSPLGNPFTEGTREENIEGYRAHFKAALEADPSLFISFRFALEAMLASYRQVGAVRLWCWCAPLACHGDVIKEWLEDQIEKHGIKDRSKERIEEQLPMLEEEHEERMDWIHRMEEEDEWEQSMFEAFGPEDMGDK